MKVCVIDIGTNSIHAVFAEIRSTGVFQVIGKDKEMVRLGDGALLDGRLSESGMASGLEVLKRFLHLAKHRGMAKVIATATSAVRESLNGGEFLDRVRRETGLKVKVITGKEEGRLVCLAVRNTVDFEGRRALVIDIGGGSAEIAVADREKTFWIESLRLGSNRLRQLFAFSDPPKKSELRRLEDYVQAALIPVLKRLKETPVDFVVGTSGTINNLARVILAPEESASSQALRQVPVTLKQLETKLAELLEMKIADRQKVRGLDKERADMIVHGGTVLAVLMRQAGLGTFKVCDKALREGVLYDHIEKNRKNLKIEEEIPDIRRRGVVTLAALCEELKSHAEHTAKLSLELFDALNPVLGLGGDADRELLEYAALVHDVGYHIGFHKHHKHTFYLVTNSELSGFSPEEISVMAWVARLHRRSVNKKDEDFAKLPPATQKRVLKLASLLRIADALDHSHFALVKGLKAREEDGAVRIKVYADADAQWEIHEALQRRDLFEKTFDKKVEFKMKVRNDDGIPTKA